MTHHVEARPGRVVSVETSKNQVRRRRYTRQGDRTEHEGPRGVKYRFWGYDNDQSSHDITVQGFLDRQGK